MALWEPKYCRCYVPLTLILLTWRIWWAPNNACKWQMWFNSVFKGLINYILNNKIFLHYIFIYFINNHVVCYTVKRQLNCKFLFVRSTGNVADRGSRVVKELCYKSEGCWFDFRRCHWNFSLTKYFRSHYGPGVNSTSNRNEYQVYFLGGKCGRCVRLTILPPSWAIVT